MGDIRVHIDTLEYTREGLKTREALNLQVGAHNRVVLVRPERREALALGSGCFDLDGCFPNPGVLSVAMIAAAQNAVNLILGLNPKSIFQVYGHAEPSGDDAHNKELSDKRAAVMLACLTGDFESVQGFAESEGWALREHQIMLRTLKCDPGAIDGEPGDLTTNATRLFQHEYGCGVFHRHLPDLDPVESPKLDGALDETTKRALIEAYVLSTSPMLTQEQLHPTHPTVGCSEFNLIDTETAYNNRRVSLVVHAHLPEHHDAAPCTEGDHSVCPLDDRDPRSRCLWYREHIRETSTSQLQQRHFDLRWFLLPNEKLLLSALTTLPDGEEIWFQPFWTKPVASQDEIGVDTLGEAIAEPMQGIIRGGVAQLVWDVPTGTDVLSPRLDADEATPRAAAEAIRREKRLMLPVFSCHGGRAQAVSPPPGRELIRLPSRGLSEEKASTGFAGVDWFGNLYQYASHGSDRQSELFHPLRDGEPLLRGRRHVAHPYAAKVKQ